MNNLTSGEQSLMLAYSEANGLTSHGFMDANPYAKALYFSMTRKRTAEQDILLDIARKELEAFNAEAVKSMESLLADLRGAK